MNRIENLSRVFQQKKKNEKEKQKKQQQQEIEFLLLFTGCTKMLGKMSASFLCLLCFLMSFALTWSKYIKM